MDDNSKYVINDEGFIARVAELEAEFPGLVFRRYPYYSDDYIAGIKDDFNRELAKLVQANAGKPIGWGVAPESATGTIKGNPFRYGFTQDCGKLEVWDGSRVPAENVPAYGIEPILFSSVDGWVSSVDYSDATKTNDLFRELLNSLHTPEGDDLLGNRMLPIIESEGIPTAREVAAEFDKLGIPLHVVPREDSFQNLTEIFLQTPTGECVRVNWDFQNSKYNRLTFILFDRTNDVFLENSLGVTGGTLPYSGIEVAVTAESIVRMIVDGLAMFDFAAVTTFFDYERWCSDSWKLGHKNGAEKSGSLTVEDFRDHVKELSEVFSVAIRQAPVLQ